MTFHSKITAVFVSIVASTLIAAGPVVTITVVPPAGQGSNSNGNIAGQVSGISNPSQYRIVLYSHTDKWYVQPEIDSPYTDIDENGHWNNWAHLGSRYAAILVRSSFKPASTLRALPSVGNDILAKKEVPAREK
jgi:hypothetical protein